MVESFSSDNERAEAVIRAERIVNVFNFDQFFNYDYGVEIVGLQKAGSFGIFKSEHTGRTILRSKEASHHDTWEDDGTVTLFHVGFNSINYFVGLMCVSHLCV